jgi:hypothetical protein
VTGTRTARQTRINLRRRADGQVKQIVQPQQLHHRFPAQVSTSVIAAFGKPCMRSASCRAVQSHDCSGLPITTQQNGIAGETQCGGTVTLAVPRRYRDSCGMPHNTRMPFGRVSLCDQSDRSGCVAMDRIQITSPTAAQTTLTVDQGGRLSLGACGGDVAIVGRKDFIRARFDRRSHRLEDCALCRRTQLRNRRAGVAACRRQGADCSRG